MDRGENKMNIKQWIKSLFGIREGYWTHDKKRGWVLDSTIYI